MRDRAVSNVVGFVLVFALISASVGVVTVFGFSTLEDARTDERINNAERAFDVLADNFADVARGGAPSRATEIKLAEASLTLAETVDLSVNASDEAAPYPAQFRPIVFSAGTGTEIAYEGGAVIRSQRGGAVMLREPNYLFSEERTVIHYIEPESASVDRVGGSSTVLVRGVRTVSRVLTAREVPSTVTLTLRLETTPERAAAWNRYFERQIDWNDAHTNASDPCAVSGGTVTCTFNSEELYVTTTRIAVEFSS
ncbi:MAG: hypothetical protein ABEJ78_09885 [Haloferacaceae archaeon]